MRRQILVGVVAGSTLAAFVACGQKSFNKDPNNSISQLLADNRANNPLVAPSPSPSPSPSPDPSPAPLAVELSESYEGDHLTLHAPHVENLGTVFIRGKSASVLYQSLAVTPVKTHLSEAYGRIKRGKNIECVRQVYKATPDDAHYSCQFYINYRNGESLLPAGVEGKPDADWAERLNRDYSAKDLMLQAGRDSFGQVFLNGPDAQMLFDVTNVPIQSPDPSWMEKFAPAYRCAELKVTTCVFSINYRTGEILPP